LFYTKMFAAATKGGIIDRANLNKFILPFQGTWLRDPDSTVILPRTTVVT
jgi:hypothetical protein